VNLPHLPAWIVFPDLKQEMSTPSPVGTLLSSAAFVTLVAIVVLVLWHKPTPAATTSLTERLLGRIERSVRSFVYYATYAFGTHYRSGWIRKPWVVTVLSVIAVAGSLLPWPTCIVVISLGLIGIFVTFLHWSQIEDDKAYFVEHRRTIPIDGDLRFEVTIAGLFILIFAPVAFAQMQLAQMGFHLDDKAGPFAFENYTLIEILKIAPLVQYYDLYSDILNFGKLGTVTDPSFQAKFAVVAFRFSSDLIILGVIKRFLDIAKRVSAGLDLNPYLNSLSDENEANRSLAINKLGEFALQNKPRARDYLEEIVTRPKYHKYLEVPLKAADRLVKVARQTNKSEGTRLLRDVIIKEGGNKFKPDEQDLRYAQFCEVMGDALLAWANLIAGELGYQSRLTEAIRQYNDALRHNPNDVQEVQNKKANAQRLLNIARGEEGSRVSPVEAATTREAVADAASAIVPEPSGSRLRLAAAAFVLMMLAATAVVAYPLLQRWRSQTTSAQTTEVPKVQPPPAPPTRGPTVPDTSTGGPQVLPTPPTLDRGTEGPTTPPPSLPPPAKIPLVLSSASLSCGKGPPISWKFGDANLIEADPIPLEITSCRLTSVTCESPIVVGIGTASVKGTDASEKDRALLRGTNLTSVLVEELKRHCGPGASVSSYVLNLGRFGGDQQGDRSGQREVMALIGKGPDTDAAVVNALQKFAQSPPWSPHYTVCDLYKMNGSDQTAQIETRTKICEEKPGTDVSQR
jgi:hypothetical protein